jgi:hypothetical protein
MYYITFEYFRENLPFTDRTDIADIAIRLVALLGRVPEDDIVRITDQNGSTKIYRKKAVSVSKDGSTTHIMTSDDEALKTKAIRAENAVTDLIDSAVDRAVSMLKGKGDDLVKSGALEPGYLQSKNDAAAIGRLGPRITDLATTFEDTISKIRERPYDEQVQLLTSYGKLLEEQINVIDSRIHLVKRLG